MTNHDSGDKQVMVSKYVSDSITEAKNALDNLQQLGGTAFNIADGVLLNIKAFVHDDHVIQKIRTKESQVETEFNRRIKKANDELKDKGPMYSFNTASDKYWKLRHWKSLEMLNFYDKLSKEHDI